MTDISPQPNSEPSDNRWVGVWMIAIGLLILVITLWVKFGFTAAALAIAPVLITGGLFVGWSKR